MTITGVFKGAFHNVNKMKSLLPLVIICLFPSFLMSEVNFSKDIAPMIFNNCTECHRPNTAAPFSLMSYRDISKRANTIANVIEDGYMPPWHPVAGFGDFEGARGLTEHEISSFREWIDAGKPMGDEAQIPTLPSFSDGWLLGEPDMIVSMPKGFSVPADGKDIYRSFVIPLDLKEDKWVKAIEIQPSARTVVHHCLFWRDESGMARKLDGRGGIPGFEDKELKQKSSLGGWAVGAQARKLPEDYAMPLPAGSDIVLSTHFHPSGKVEVEKTKIGIYLSDKPSSKTVMEMQVPGFYGKYAGLDIPAGESDFVLRGKMQLPMDIEILTAGAHMHYLGTSAKGWATLPNGEVKPLLYIDEWDFNWQGDYHYREPVFLPKGTIVETEIHYDNSSANPFNPYDPPQRIKWGLESEDEMGSLIFMIVPKKEEENSIIQNVMNQSMALAARKQNASTVMELTYENFVKKIDKDGDGIVQVSEIPKQYQKFMIKTDRNKNGNLEEDELVQVKSKIAKVWETL